MKPPAPAVSASANEALSPLPLAVRRAYQSCPSECSPLTGVSMQTWRFASLSVAQETDPIGTPIGGRVQDENSPLTSRIIWYKRPVLSTTRTCNDPPRSTAHEIGFAVGPGIVNGRISGGGKSAIHDSA